MFAQPTVTFAPVRFERPALVERRFLGAFVAQHGLPGAKQPGKQQQSAAAQDARGDDQGDARDGETGGRIGPVQSARCCELRAYAAAQQPQLRIEPGAETESFTQHRDDVSAEHPAQDSCPYETDIHLSPPPTSVLP